MFLVFHFCFVFNNKEYLLMFYQRFLWSLRALLGLALPGL